MKKILVVVIIIIILLISSIKPKSLEKNEETRAVFISYIELNEYVKANSIEESKKNIDKMISNIKKTKFNTIILQVRSCSDAIYNSKLFPYSMYVSGTEGKYFYDVLDYFIMKCHEKDMKLYAWINPYRVRTSEDVSTIAKDNPAYKYLETDTIYINKGIYFNPAKKEVEKLIVDGVKEVIKYDVDGVLFDDYFYPSDDIDEKDYLEYLKSNKYITKEEYHLNNVNEMVKKVYSVCHKKKIKFGISPEGNIENNYNKNYADVKRWMKSDGYIDFIMPQVYYGFYNSTKDFAKVIKEWESLVTNDNIELLIALAFYKVGREDKYAKEGRDEWMLSNNIIMREIILSRNLNHYRGFALFRYDNLFDINSFTPNSINEIENMKKILNY
ncbi:MAG: family 10 glycosylhydrolase [Bacilli bacterium]|nr:family 10 glycosylhydrolase [Bacilli bacterium]